MRESSCTAKTVIVVMGVAGSGKTTIVGLLGEHLGWSVAGPSHPTVRRM